VNSPGETFSMTNAPSSPCTVCGRVLPRPVRSSETVKSLTGWCVARSVTRPSTRAGFAITSVTFFAGASTSTDVLSSMPGMNAVSVTLPGGTPMVNAPVASLWPGVLPIPRMTTIASGTGDPSVYVTRPATVTARST
jgi:hypothetical protein